MTPTKLHAVLLPAALACFAQTADAPRTAQSELYAARYKSATELYAATLKENPADPDAHCGLVRALIAGHRSADAYAAAEEALRRNPNSAGVQTAAGLAEFRRGDLAKAEQYFQSALRMDAGYSGALQGMAAINDAVSRFKTARDLFAQAYKKTPGDPELILAHARTLRGAEHIQALREALAILDPETEEARRVRTHIANDLAVGDRKLRRLASPYQAYRIGLFRLLNGPKHFRGVGLRVRMNGKTVNLLLDTGASGISVSPKFAEHADLEILGDQSSEAKGIGDGVARPSFRYIVSELRVGDLVFNNYPVSVFRSAKSRFR